MEQISTNERGLVVTNRKKVNRPRIHCGERFEDHIPVYDRTVERITIDEALSRSGAASESLLCPHCFPDAPESRLFDNEVLEVGIHRLAVYWPKAKKRPEQSEFIAV